MKRRRANANAKKKEKKKEFTPINRDTAYAKSHEEASESRKRELQKLKGQFHF